MTRSVRILVAAGALVLLVVATALAAPSDRGRDRMSPVAASHQPSPGAADRDDGPPSAEHLERLVTLLGEAGVSTDAATIEALAARYGVGGAVRLLAWSEGSGVSTDELAAMFDSGMGWGEIAHQLNEDNGTSLHPGLGPIMSGHGQGHGRDGAPGQQKKAD
jgi:hypothetical protein